MLFVNARFDAASSFAHTQTLVAAVPGARLLSLEGAGHPASFVPDMCLNDANTTHLIGQQMPAAGAVYQPDFQPFEAGD